MGAFITSSIQDPIGNIIAKVATVVLFIIVMYAPRESQIFKPNINAYWMLYHIPILLTSIKLGLRSNLFGKAEEKN